MTDDLPYRPEPIEWLIYASREQAATQIEAAAKNAGLTARLSVDFDSPEFATDDSVPFVPLGTCSGSVRMRSTTPRGFTSDPLVAAVVIRSLPGSKCTFEAAPSRNAWEESTLIKSWELFVDAARTRLAVLGFDVDDMRSPTFVGVRALADTSTAVRKPSERSMWASPIFYERVFRKRDDLCFVIMPFRDAQLQFVEHAVKPVVESLGLECKLANEFRGGHNDIVEEIWVALNEARFLIVDLTGQNPNVYYELGIANTLGKQIIAIHKKGAPDEDARLPFDVRTRRTVFYEDTMAGGAAFQKELREHIEAILQSQA